MPIIIASLIVFGPCLVVIVLARIGLLAPNTGQHVAYCHPGPDFQRWESRIPAPPKLRAVPTDEFMPFAEPPVCGPRVPVWVAARPVVWIPVAERTDFR